MKYKFILFSSWLLKSPEDNFVQVNNAGVATQFPHKLTQDGIETTFQACTVGALNPQP